MKRDRRRHERRPPLPEPGTRSPPLIVLSNRNWVASGPGVQFVRTGIELPAGKAEREVFVARLFADEVLSKRGRRWDGLESCKDDPPDVLGTENGLPFGIELVEVVAEARRRGRARLAAFERGLANVAAAARPRFKGRAFAVRFADALLLEQPLPGSRRLEDLASAVVAALDACQQSGPVPLPAPLESVQLAGEVHAGDPRLAHPDDPVFLLDALTIASDPYVVSAVVADRLERKLTRGSTGRHLLLLWSQDVEFFHLFGAAREELRTFLGRRPANSIPYDEVFLFPLPHLDRVLAWGCDIPPGLRAK